MIVFPIYVIQDIYKQSFHLSFLRFLLQLIVSSCSPRELSTVLKQRHRHHIVARHPLFLTLYDFRWTRCPSHSSTTEQSLGSNAAPNVQTEIQAWGPSSSTEENRTGDCCCTPSSNPLVRPTTGQGGSDGQGDLAQGHHCRDQQQA